MKDKSNSLYICICILLLVLGFHLRANIEDEIVAYFRAANIDANNVITACGIIITSMFAFFGLKEARRTTKLQAEPFLHCQRETDYGSNTYQFHLLNSGTGTVINIKYKLLYNSDLISFAKLRSLLGNVTDKDKSLEHSFCTMEAIRPGSKFAFIDLNLTELNDLKFHCILHLLSDIELSIDYETVLGEFRHDTFKLYY